MNIYNYLCALNMLYISCYVQTFYIKYKPVVAQKKTGQLLTA